MLGILAFCGGFLQAQDTALADRLTAASELSSLQSPDLKPWHMKLNVTVFDDDGKHPQSGTIEVWKSGTSSRSVSTFGDSVSTLLRVGSKNYRSSPGPEIPYRATEVLQHVLHTGPTREEILASTPQLRKQSFGKVQLDCIMLTQPIKGEDNPPLGLFPTYCLEPDTNILLLSYDFGSESVIPRSLGKFLGQQVPLKLEIVDGSKTVATSEIVALATYQPQPNEFDPTPDMHTNGMVRVASGVVTGQRLTLVQPVYPSSAKQRHISGTVVLRAVIGRDGHVHALHPQSSPDTDLTIAAIAAVRQWTYKPYLLNGEPTEVETTITVNFNLGSGLPFYPAQRLPR
jgi:TonB family protein